MIEEEDETEEERAMRKKMEELQMLGQRGPSLR